MSKTYMQVIDGSHTAEIMKIGRGEGEYAGTFKHVWWKRSQSHHNSWWMFGERQNEKFTTTAHGSAPMSSLQRLFDKHRWQMMIAVAYIMLLFINFIFSSRIQLVEKVEKWILIFNNH